MVKKETVRIGDKDYVLKCSVMTAETFEKVTGKQFGKTLSKYLSFDRAMSDGDLSQEEKNELMLDSYFSIQGDMMRLAYCMILEAKRAGDNQDFEYELVEWMEEVGGLDANALKGVLAVATALFPRKIKNEEKYKAKAKTDQDLDIDVYSLIATGLKVGLRLNDFYELDFVTLINILDSFYESNNHRKPKYREATQQDIDMIT